MNYIIVGQGLAGSALALQLILRGKRVMVFDELRKNRCSIEAAGLFNPITGKSFGKTWLVDKIFPSLYDFYPTAERLLEKQFFYPQSIYRPFLSIEEQNELMGKSAEESFNSYFEEVFVSSRFGNQVYDPFGGILLKQCGYVDVVAFLTATQEFLKKNDSYTDGYIDEAKLEISADYVKASGVTAEKIIFCNGTNANQSVFFNWLPIVPLKGETLVVELEDKAEVIFNRGVYVVPFDGNNRYKVGATYPINDRTEGISESGKEELEKKLSALLRMPFKTAAQGWGIRPTTLDRRPMLGVHPSYQNIVIFNGLGTKGVSLVPYFSGHLAEWLTGKGEISKEVIINRYNALYSKSLGVGSKL